MINGYFICKYDRTSCGGVVLESDALVKFHGKEHVLEGAAVSCGVDGKVYQIEGGIPNITSRGTHVAGTLHSFSNCPCRAEIKASEHAAFYAAADSSPNDLQLRMRAFAVPPAYRSPDPVDRPLAPYPEEIEEEEEEVELEQSITLRIGVFFDGTGNNRSNSEKVYGCFARNVNLEEAAEDIRRFCLSQGFDGQGSAPDDSRGNDSSNVARLYDLYRNNSEEQLNDDEVFAAFPVYIEGIGTSSIERDSRFSQATGRGAQGVRARVEQSPGLLLKILKTFQGNNPDRRIKRIEFDIFGFSRGAAAARDFANEVLKGAYGVVGKAMPPGTPGLEETFAWRRNSDFCINFIGIFDTVAAISAPLQGDFSGNNNLNPGIDIRLAPDAARKVVHLVAQDERRYNFSLNKAGNDIVLPGAHSDLGGGYRPDVTERLLLSKPHHSEIGWYTPITSAPSYQYAQADLLMLKAQYFNYGLPLEIRTWQVELTSNVKGIAEKTRRLYAAVFVERTVHSDLALVYLRIMRELAVQHGVPFQEIPAKNKRLALPQALVPINEKLLAYALGKTTTYGLTTAEEQLLYQRYVHLSSHWTPVTHDMAQRDFVFINRPGDNGRRTVHPNE
ncbi:phospholipase effector Tle1 domain-containing protein [Pseudomonas abietaniphila]|uniref:phospholipase effector Tle1 domain-containing protein n=1 Tax=Pseudomonas abietaniphila TaxID=89065 RepID=UPI000AB8376F|nr:DUF2235 domain-containing protein [Pseudomonas abietaniphila]